MELINLTPHDVNLIGHDDKRYLSIPPTFPPARCVEKFHEGSVISYETYSGGVINIPVGTISYSDVYNLPEEVHDRKYIVSVLVAQQFPYRMDLLVPHDLVRKNGHIVGCRRLVRII